MTLQPQMHYPMTLIQTHRDCNIDFTNESLDDVITNASVSGGIQNRCKLQQQKARRDVTSCSEDFFTEEEKHVNKTICFVLSGY